MDENMDVVDGSAVHMARLSRPRRWAALFVLLLGMVVLSIDMTIMDIALPSIAKELHPTADQQLWMVDVYSLALAGLLVSASFSVEQLAGLGLSDSQIADALGSYGGAVAVAQETGVAELITQGALSFNESLVFSALAGGVLLIVLALVVGRLIPKGFSIAEED